MEDDEAEAGALMKISFPRSLPVISITPVSPFPLYDRGPLGTLGAPALRLACVDRGNLAVGCEGPEGGVW